MRMLSPRGGRALCGGTEGGGMLHFRNLVYLVIYNFRKESFEHLQHLRHTSHPECIHAANVNTVCSPACSHEKATLGDWPSLSCNVNVLCCLPSTTHKILETSGKDDWSNTPSNRKQSI